MPPMRCEWDPVKDQENQAKHGVTFTTAQLAFLDPHRVIAEDLSHSGAERRYFCFGRVGGGCSRCGSRTARTRSESSGPAIGGKGSGSMRNRIKYTDEPIGDVRVVRDFLPPPDQLVLREEPVKVTIALSRRSVEFFKAEAARHHTQYQKMIRRLLDQYAEHYAGREATRVPASGRRRRVA